MAEPLLEDLRIRVTQAVAWPGSPEMVGNRLS
jgi:hypothetical protein